MLNLYLSLIEDHSYDGKLERIYRQYKDLMYKVALAVTKDAHDAEEAVSLAMISIAKRIATVDDTNEQKLKSYLSTIVKNKAIDVIKSKNRHATDDIELYPNIESELDGYDYLINEESYKEIVKLILKMPDIYRDVLTLKYLHNLSTKEISTLFNLPINTVKSRLSRGKALIAEIIKETNEYARSAN